MRSCGAATLRSMHVPLAFFSRSFTIAGAGRGAPTSLLQSAPESSNALPVFLCLLLSTASCQSSDHVRRHTNSIDMVSVDATLQRKLQASHAASCR